MNTPYSATGPIDPPADSKPLTTRTTVVSSGMPKAFGAPAPSTASEKVPRVSKTRWISFEVAFDPAAANTDSVVQAVTPAAVDAMLDNGPGGPPVDPKRVLVDSVAVKVVSNECNFPLGITLEGVALNGESEVHLDSEGNVAGVYHFVAPAGHASEGSMFVADAAHKQTLREVAPGISKVHTHASLSAHEQHGHDLDGVVVHCASPVFDSIYGGLSAELKAELNAKRTRYGKGEQQKLNVHLKDATGYQAAKRQLIAASQENTTHHTDLTTLGIRVSNADGRKYSDVPAALDGASSAVKAAHSDQLHRAHIKVGVKYYVDLVQ